MSDYDKNEESSYFTYWSNNLYDWAFSQKLHVNEFKWVEYLSEFNENFKAIIKNVMKDIFLKLMFSILKIYMNFTMM